MAADPRYLSNRIFNDRHQNLHSARGLTQWVWLWGQFIDHTIGLRDGNGEQADLPCDTSDPLEEFVNETGTIPFQRSAFDEDEDGTHEQSNNVSSFIDAFNVYGGSEERLEWLREGPVDGELSNTRPPFSAQMTATCRRPTLVPTWRHHRWSSQGACPARPRVR